MLILLCPWCAARYHAATNYESIQYQDNPSTSGHYQQQRCIAILQPPRGCWQCQPRTGLLTRSLVMFSTTLVASSRCTVQSADTRSSTECSGHEAPIHNSHVAVAHIDGNSCPSTCAWYGGEACHGPEARTHQTLLQCPHTYENLLPSLLHPTHFQSLLLLHAAIHTALVVTAIALKTVIFGLGVADTAASYQDGITLAVEMETNTQVRVGRPGR